MNKILDNLNEVSRRTQRDLGVAIVVAQRPGYHNYYQAPEEVQMVIRNGELKKMAKKIERLQTELDSLDYEMAQIEAAKPKPVPSEGPQINSLQQVRPVEVSCYSNL